MSLESLNRLSELTGFTHRTIKGRIADLLVPIIEGRSHLYESRDVFPLLYSGADGVEYDLVSERARLAHHQANNEAIKEQVAMGQLIPAELVVKNGAAMVAAARAKILGAHNKIKNRFSDIPPAAIDELEGILIEALDELGNDGIPPELEAVIDRHARRLAAAAEADD